jgi:hypothetical protein
VIVWGTLLKCAGSQILGLGLLVAPVYCCSIGPNVVTVSIMSLSPQFMEGLWVRKYVYKSYDISEFSPIVV